MAASYLDAGNFTDAATLRAPDVFRDAPPPVPTAPAAAPVAGPLPFVFSLGHVNLEPTLDLPRTRTGPGPLGPRHRARLARITRGKP